VSQRLPSLTSAELIRALEQAGFHIVRQTGSHVIMHKKGFSAFPVPKHTKELKRSLQTQIIKEAGFAIEEFSKFL
jgi:Predicted periplasmic or secreted lipoprotein